MKSSSTEAPTPHIEKQASGQAEQIRAGQFWLVIYEHRPAVITIAPCGTCFFACGQEELWPLTEVQAWLRRIKVVEPVESSKPKSVEEQP